MCVAAAAPMTTAAACRDASYSTAWTDRPFPSPPRTTVARPWCGIRHRALLHPPACAGRPAVLEPHGRRLRAGRPAPSMAGCILATWLMDGCISMWRRGDERQARGAGKPERAAAAAGFIPIWGNGELCFSQTATKGKPVHCFVHIFCPSFVSIVFVWKSGKRSKRKEKGVIRSITI
ncbi:hypothetical protein ACQJBY_032015 [Aegilops geniculata]